MFSRIFKKNKKAKRIGTFNNEGNLRTIFNRLESVEQKLKYHESLVRDIVRNNTGEQSQNVKQLEMLGDEKIKDETTIKKLLTTVKHLEKKLAKKGLEMEQLIKNNSEVLIENMEKRVKTLTEQQETIMESVTINSSNSSLENRMNIINNKLSSMESHQNQSDSTISQISSKINQLEQAKNQLEDKYVDNQRHEDIIWLKHEQGTFTTDFEKVKKEMFECSNAITELKQKYQDQKKTIDALVGNENIIESLVIDVVQLREKCKIYEQKENEVDSCDATKLQAETKTNIEDIHAHINNLQENQEQLKMSLNTLEETFVNSKIVNEKLARESLTEQHFEEKFNQFQKFYEKNFREIIDHQFHLDEFDDLKEKVDQLNEKYKILLKQTDVEEMLKNGNFPETITNQLGQLERVNHKLHEEFVDIKNNQNSLMEQVNDLNDKHKDTAKPIDQLVTPNEAVAKKLERNIKACHEKCNELQKSIDNQNLTNQEFCNFNELKEKIEAIEGICSNYKSQLDQIGNTRDKKINEVQERILNYCKINLKSKEQDIIQLTDSSKNVLKQLADHQKANDSLKQELSLICSKQVQLDKISFGINVDQISQINDNKTFKTEIKEMQNDCEQQIQKVLEMANNNEQAIKHVTEQLKQAEKNLEDVTERNVLFASKQELILEKTKDIDGVAINKAIRLLGYKIAIFDNILNVFGVNSIEMNKILERKKIFNDEVKINNTDWQEINDKIKQLEDNSSQQNSEQNKIKEDIEQLTNKIKKCEENQQDIQKLEEQIRKLQNIEADGSELQFDKLKTRLTNLKNENKQVEKLQEELNLLKFYVEKTSIQHDKLEEHIEVINLKKLIEDQDIKIKSLLKSNEEVNGDYLKQKTQNEEVVKIIKTRIDEMTNNLVSIEERVNENRTELHKYLDEKNSTHATFQEHTENYKIVEDAVGILQNKYDFLNNEVSTKYEETNDNADKLKNKIEKLEVSFIQVEKLQEGLNLLKFHVEKSSMQDGKLEEHIEVKNLKKLIEHQGGEIKSLLKLNEEVYGDYSKQKTQNEEAVKIINSQVHEMMNNLVNIEERVNENRTELHKYCDEKKAIQATFQEHTENYKMVKDTLVILQDKYDFLNNKVSTKCEESKDNTDEVNKKIEKLEASFIDNRNYFDNCLKERNDVLSKAQDNLAEHKPVSGELKPLENLVAQIQNDIHQKFIKFETLFEHYETSRNDHQQFNENIAKIHEKYDELYTNLQDDFQKNYQQLNDLKYKVSQVEDIFLNNKEQSDTIWEKINLVDQMVQEKIGTYTLDYENSIENTVEYFNTRIDFVQDIHKSHTNLFEEIFSKVEENEKEIEKSNTKINDVAAKVHQHAGVIEEIDRKHEEIARMLTEDTLKEESCEALKQSLDDLSSKHSYQEEQFKNSEQNITKLLNTEQACNDNIKKVQTLSDEVESIAKKVQALLNRNENYEQWFLETNKDVKEINKNLFTMDYKCKSYEKNLQKCLEDNKTYNALFETVKSLNEDVINLSRDFSNIDQKYTEIEKRLESALSEELLQVIQQKIIGFEKSANVYSRKSDVVQNQVENISSHVLQTIDKTRKKVEKYEEIMDHIKEEHNTQRKDLNQLQENSKNFVTENQIAAFFLENSKSYYNELNAKLGEMHDDQKLFKVAKEDVLKEINGKFQLLKEELMKGVAATRTELGDNISNSSTQMTTAGADIKENDYLKISLKKIDDVHQETENIAEEINRFQGTTTDKTFLHLNELLIRNMLKLDNIDSEGFEEIRKRRKEVLQYVQYCQNVLKKSASADTL